MAIREGMSGRAALQYSTKKRPGIFQSLRWLCVYWIRCYLLEIQCGKLLIMCPIQHQPACCVHSKLSVRFLRHYRTSEFFSTLSSKLQGEEYLQHHYRWDRFDDRFSIEHPASNLKHAAQDSSDSKLESWTTPYNCMHVMTAPFTTTRNHSPIQQTPKKSLKGETEPQCLTCLLDMLKVMKILFEVRPIAVKEKLVFFSGEIAIQNLVINCAGNLRGSQVCRSQFVNR